ncbi:MAG: hypothetical protein A2V93_07345 [Ignavibacteria bacterium RBG_16_34_14]|nr:MAG: hypothetical protein A2V93_07345 [Ignavibacteria bacterium RBG_16_34_14]
MPLDKEALIRYRLERSLETISEAEQSIQNNHLHLAANRIYYAIFYAVSALSVKNNFSTSKHSTLLSWFNNEFVKKQIITKELGNIYNIAFQNRMKGDYDDLITFSKESILENFNQMKLFVQKINQIIGNK